MYVYVRLCVCVCVVCVCVRVCMWCVCMLTYHDFEIVVTSEMAEKRVKDGSMVDMDG